MSQKNKLHSASLAFVDHFEMLQKCAPYESAMQLASRAQVNTSKGTIDCVLQRRDIHLGQVHIDLSATVYSADFALIDNRQI